MPWRPSAPGERPTLGWSVIDWMEAHLARPDQEDYAPYLLTREQAEFLLRFYELDPVTGRRVNSRGVVSRPRGWGKSPFVSAIAIAEALADVVPAGWDAEGQPVGRPWRTIRKAIVSVAAMTEDQTRNSWLPLLEMLHPAAPLHDVYPDVEPLDSFVNLPGPRGSRIRPITSSATSIKGEPSIFVIMDQTESWTRRNGGVKFAETLRNNTTKVGAAGAGNGSSIETPNAFTPGEDSVAEATAAAAAAIAEGRSRLTTGLLYDHREAPPETDQTDRESLTAGLRVAYGDSSDHPDGCVLHNPPCAPGWAPIEAFLERTWHPDMDPQQAAADFLNQVTHASDAWLAQPEWKARTDASAVVADGDVVVLGFDGSRGRARGKPDATALIGCRVSDGHLFQVAVWEADDRYPDAWETWQPSIAEVEAELERAFQRWSVVGLYCDPGRDWRSHVNAWEARYSARLTVRVSRDHPCEWWMTGGRSALVERAVESLEGAVRNGDCTHDGASALTRHVLNARRRFSHGKLALGKEHSHSVRKVDAAVAAVLAWQARLDAVAQGIGRPRRSVTFGRIY